MANDPVQELDSIIARASAYWYGDKTSLDAACEAQDILKALAALRVWQRPQQACMEPAPDRSGRTCDKPVGHNGEHWTYGGNTLEWQRPQPNPPSLTTPEGSCLICGEHQPFAVFVNGRPDNPLYPLWVGCCERCRDAGKALRRQKQKRRVPERFTDKSLEGCDAQKAWLHGYDTAVGVQRPTHEERITTRCPNCGHQTLFIGSGGYLTCSWLECSNPSVGGWIEQQKEFVICAAVKTKEGPIVRGHRHDGAIVYAEQMGLHLVPYGQDQQGFVTSRGRYVNRLEAAAIQKTAGIKTVDPNRIDFPSELFSEDLY